MKTQRGPECWAYILGRQSCQLYAPAALYSQRNYLVLISVTGWVDPRAAECGQKEWVTLKFPRTPSCSAEVKISGAISALPRMPLWHAHGQLHLGLLGSGQKSNVSNLPVPHSLTPQLWMFCVCRLICALKKVLFIAYFVRTVMYNSLHVTLVMYTVVFCTF